MWWLSLWWLQGDLVPAFTAQPKASRSNCSQRGWENQRGQEREKLTDVPSLECHQNPGTEWGERYENNTNLTSAFSSLLHPMRKPIGIRRRWWGKRWIVSKASFIKASANWDRSQIMENDTLMKTCYVPVLPLTPSLPAKARKKRERAGERVGEGTSVRVSAGILQERKT